MLKKWVGLWFALRAIRVASLLVPGHRRVKWLREWSGEVWARSDSGRTVVWPALGAYRHGAWLRWEAWTAGLWSVDGELRYAMRTLLRRPLFSVTVVVTLALGIGATTAVFSVVDKVLVAPLPYPGGDRLLRVTAQYEPIDGGHFDLTPELLHAWGARTTTLEVMESFSVRDRNLIGSGTPTVVQEARVTSGFLRDLLDVSPLVGRAFDPRENEPGLGSVAMLSESLWRERFGATVDVIGRTIRIDDRSLEIIGVLPEVAILPLVDVWTPADLSVDWDQAGTILGTLKTLVRARPGVGLEAVRQDLATISEEAGAEFGRTVEPWRAEAFDYRTQLVGEVKANLWILMGAVVAVLLIACVNVTNLLLARGAERAPELVLRSSLGASSGTLVRQVFLEGAVLAAVSGLVGMGLAWVGVDVLMGWVPSEIPLVTTTDMDGRVLLFGFSATVLTGLLFSVLPALRLGKLSIGRISAPGASIGRRERGRGAILLGLEVAQASALLVAAILMVTTLVHERDADSGFDPDGILFVHLNMPTYDYGAGVSSDPRDRFIEELRPRIAALPGVERVGVGTATPFTGITFMLGLQQEGGPRDGAGDGGLSVASQKKLIYFAQLWVDAAYLETLGLPIVSGRPLRDSDRGGDAVVLINETAAEAYWPHESPLGRRVRRLDEGPWTTIVGVVRDFEHPGMPTAGLAEIYAPLGASTQLVNLLVRFDGDADVVRQQIRRTIWTIDPDLPIPAMRTAREVLAASLGMTRFYTLLLGLFAGLAILLTSVGIYGVMAYSVARRTREMGIRMALGADGTRVAAVILREGMAVVVAGLIVGLLLARAGSRVMESLLFEVESTDPFTYGVVALVVSVAGAAAAWFPARRATTVDPIEVLRAD